MDPSVMAQFGLTGVILGWFMWRNEVRLRSLERSMDRLSRAILIDVMSRSGSSDEAVRQARVELRHQNRGESASQDEAE